MKWCLSTGSKPPEQLFISSWARFFLDEHAAAVTIQQNQAFHSNQLKLVERSSSSGSPSQAAQGLNSQVGQEKPGNDISTGRPITAGLKPQWRKHVCLIWGKKPEAEG